MNLYITIGIPGSGKSTWSEKFCKENGYIRLSTDEYRKKLFGDVDCQTKNKELFEALYSDLKQCLKNGQNVVFDATSITKADREKIFTYLKDVEDLKIYAAYFPVSLEVSFERNRKRERHVSEDVIKMMYEKLNPPTLDEGFTEIINFNEKN